MKNYTELVLPDVTVLIAWAWPNHQFHGAADRWFESVQGPWATCVLTELGFIRLSTNPIVVGTPKRPGEVLEKLSLFTQDQRHVYLSDLPEPRSWPVRKAFSKLSGTKQVTDAYLLCVGKHHGAKFVTFDGRMRTLSPADVDVLT